MPKEQVQLFHRNGEIPLKPIRIYLTYKNVVIEISVIKWKSLSVASLAFPRPYGGETTVADKRSPCPEIWIAVYPRRQSIPLRTTRWFGYQRASLRLHFLSSPSCERRARVEHSVAGAGPLTRWSTKSLVGTKASLKTRF